MAIFGMGVMVGPTLGPTLGGWITDNYSWPWIFYINVPLGLLAAVLTWRWVTEPSHLVRRTRVDWLGLALLILGIGALQVLLERGESKDWFESREIIVETIVAGVGVVAFIWHELTTSNPIVNLRILRNRQLAGGVAFAVILGFALYSSVFALPVFLQNLLGYSAWDTGRVLFPGAIASAFTMAMMGRLSGRFDARLLVTIGVLLFLWSMWLHYHFTTAIGMNDLLLPMVLRGVGLGFIFVPLTGAAVADLRTDQLAQGTGLFNLARQLGGSFGIAVTATLLSRFTEQSREALLPHLAAGSPSATGWLQQATARLASLGSSLPEAQQRAHALLEATLRQQASMVAFEKVFLTMGLTFVAALPLLLLFRVGRARGGAGVH
jgi:DHA2 family multidrug resistance protein